MKPNKAAVETDVVDESCASDAAASAKVTRPIAKDGRTKAPRKARSDAFEAIHSAASGLFAAGIIDKTTMREFDVDCLVAPNLGANDVKRIRASVQLSQEVFARYLGTNKSTVQKWESAVNQPNPMAQRLLKVIEKFGLNALV